jgi:general secretion pathway protein E/type IV pilus assembly protein PilB
MLADEGRVEAKGDGISWTEAVDRLLSGGTITMEEIVAGLSETYAVPLLEAWPVGYEPPALDLITHQFAKEHQVLPLKVDAYAFTVAISDPLDLETLDELALKISKRVEARLAAPEQLAEAITAAYLDRSEKLPTEETVAAEPTIAALSEEAQDIAIEGIDEAVSEEDGPIIGLVEQIIAEAIRRRASDIHLEPGERRFRLRYRIDGRLQEISSPPRQLQSAVISRLKLMARLSLAEKRLPQDGRIRVRSAGKELDFRVSSLPSVFGETIVMRILDKEGLKIGLPELGMMPDDEAELTRMISQPDGIVLVTGPTGSGKSTTLYAALQHLNRSDRKIITVEDPVEYQVSGINQVAVRPEIGMDFSSALRAMLRQAPNVIMVGEIRDRETAEIAINASLTGHLVFSTLHTNDAPSAVSRLVDLGAKSFLVSTALRGVLAQRLIRMICPECRETYVADEMEMKALKMDLSTAATHRLVRGRGCAHCAGTGYRGRKGIFELCAVDEVIEGLIYDQASLVELRQRARDQGMRTLREDGLRKVAAGWTTLTEVLAVTVGDQS